MIILKINGIYQDEAGNDKKLALKINEIIEWINIQEGSIDGIAKQMNPGTFNHNSPLPTSGKRINN